MNINQILVAMIGELGKLLLRSEGKTDTLANAGLKCLHLLSHSFADIEGLTQGLAEDKIHALFEHWYPEKEAPEPCYVPFSPNGKNKKNSTGYLIHIFKGEQDIMPSPLDQISIEAKPYHRILHSLKHDVKSIVGALSVDTWVHILHRYCKWIPASIALSHISLYHYTRLKMALAACLKPEEIQKILEKFQSGQKKPRFLFSIAACSISWQRSHFIQSNSSERCFYFKRPSLLLANAQRKLYRSLSQSRRFTYCQ